MAGVKLNGEPVRQSIITRGDIMNRGRLEFEMSSRPNEKRIFTEERKPYSMTVFVQCPAFFE